MILGNLLGLLWLRFLIDKIGIMMDSTYQSLGIIRVLGELNENSQNVFNTVPGTEYTLNKCCGYDDAAATTDCCHPFCSLAPNMAWPLGDFQS